MATNPIQLDDSVLLAWIEGELSPERHQLVTRAMSENPALQARADAMRLDRFTLSALGEEKAPADLLGGVADLLEREMLIGTAGSDDFRAAEDSPGHADTTSVFNRDVAGRIAPARRFSPPQLAMAAGLLLVVGAGAWIGGMMFAGRTSPPPNRTTGPIAQTRNDPPTIEGAEFASSETDRVETTLADASERGTSLAAAEPTVERDLASNEPITAERAVELLSQGRLVVRVRMADLSGLAWIEGVQTERGVHIERDIPAALAAALEPEQALPFQTRRDAPMLAMNPGSFVGPPADLRIDTPDLPERVVASIVRVEMSADARTLSAALRGLRSQEGIVTAEFEDAGEPLPTQIERPTSESILWWRQPPREWTPKAKVPVVFEVLR